MTLTPQLKKLAMKKKASHLSSVCKPEIDLGKK